MAKEKPPEPLDVLRKGFSALKQHMENKKRELEELQWTRGKLSDADENWLDHEGNVIDELLLIEKLEAFY